MLVLRSEVLITAIVIPVIYIFFLLVKYGLCLSLWFQLWLLLLLDDQVKYFQDLMDYCSLL